MTGTKLNRRKAFHAGIAAEKHVCAFLEARRFELLNHRYKTRDGEIDLVMRLEILIVFIEVKARAALAGGLYSVTPRAQKRICDSARLWIAEHDEMIGPDTDFRFDVAIVTPDNDVTLLKGAFEACE